MGAANACYPQEVDLSGLATGEPVKQFQPPTPTIIQSAQGMPSWYRPIAVPFKGAALSIDDIRDDGPSKASRRTNLGGAKHQRVGNHHHPKRTTNRSGRTAGGDHGVGTGAAARGWCPGPRTRCGTGSTSCRSSSSSERLRYLNIGKGLGPVVIDDWGVGFQCALTVSMLTHRSDP